MRQSIPSINHKMPEKEILIIQVQTGKHAESIMVDYFIPYGHDMQGIAVKVKRKKGMSEEHYYERIEGNKYRLITEEETEDRKSEKKGLKDIIFS